MVDKFPDRLSYIGGSEVAAALGVSPYKTQVDLWLEKTGQVGRPDLSENEAVYWGTVLEEPIARAAEDRYGLKPRRDNREYRHPQHDYLRAHIDRRVQGEPRQIMEIKAVGLRTADQWGEEGTDQVPLWYATQALHYMELANSDLCHVLALVGGQELRHYVLPYREDIAKRQTELLVEWWQRHVVEGAQPPPATTDDVAKLYPQAKSETLVASEYLSGLAERRREAAGEAAQAKERLEAVDLLIKQEMGAADALTAPDGKVLATWKNCSAKRLDQKRLKAEFPELYSEFERTSDYRVFLWKK